jgi:hypothetical protein
LIVMMAVTASANDNVVATEHRDGWAGIGDDWLESLSLSATTSLENSCGYRLDHDPKGLAFTRGCRGRIPLRHDVVEKWLSMDDAEEQAQERLEKEHVLLIHFQATITLVNLQQRLLEGDESGTLFGPEITLTVVLGSGQLPVTLQPFHPAHRQRLQRQQLPSPDLALDTDWWTYSEEIRVHIPVPRPGAVAASFLDWALEVIAEPPLPSQPTASDSALLIALHGMRLSRTPPPPKLHLERHSERILLSQLSSRPQGFTPTTTSFLSSTVPEHCRLLDSTDAITLHNVRIASRKMLESVMTTTSSTSSSSSAVITPQMKPLPRILCGVFTTHNHHDTSTTVSAFALINGQTDLYCRQ